MLLILALKVNVSQITNADLYLLTVILHAELLPVDRSLSCNFSTSLQVLHLRQEKKGLYQRAENIAGTKTNTI